MKTHRKGKESLKQQCKDFNDDAWDRCCLELKMRILRKDPEHLIFDVLRRFLGATEKVAATIDSPVGDVFDTHISNVLHGMGLYSVREVLNVSPIMLYTKAGLGEARTNSIIARCREVLEGKVLINASE